MQKLSGKMKRRSKIERGTQNRIQQTKVSRNSCIIPNVG